MKQIKFPINCTELKDKLKFAYRAQELLRLEHNDMGRQYRENKISDLQWKSYIGQHKTCNYTLSCFIAENREIVMKSELGIDELDYKNEVQMTAILQKKNEFKNSMKFDVEINNLWQ